MIRVLQFGLSHNLGGIETYLKKLATHIDKDEVQFDFLINGFEKPCFYDELKKMNSIFHFVTPRTKNIFKNRKEIDKILSENNYDVVHCNLNSLSYIYPVMAAIKSRTPVIVHSRNAGIQTSRKSQILHYLNYWRLPQSKIKKLAVSTEAGEWMFGEGKEFTVVNNGIYSNEYKYDEVERRKLRNYLDLTPNDKVIINVGALREQKNHLFQIDILNELIQIDKSYKLLLVGTGELKEEISNRVAELKLNDRVIFLGNMDHVSNALSAADLFLFPSLYEGFPNAVLEAQTSGLPVILSDVITKEVKLSSNVQYVSLEKTARQWADTIERTSLGKKRAEAYRLIEHNKLTVLDEVRKIENIYKSMS